MLTGKPSQCGTSTWSEALPSPGATTIESVPREADVVVIGAGLTGLSAAYHVLAKRPGARVVVLEAERVGYGASSRNSGMLTPGVGQDLAALVRRFGEDAARAMYLRSLEAVQYVRQLADAEGFDAGLTMTGQLVAAHGRSGRSRLRRQADTLERLDLPVERLDESGLHRRIRIATEVSGDDDAGPAALRLPIAGTLHPGRLVAGLCAAICRRGGRIVEGAKVVALSQTAPVHVSLDNGHQIVAQHVVVATSGYSKSLNLQRGRLVPLHLRVLLTEPLNGAQLADLNWHGREGVIDSRRLFNYMRLTEDDRILFGGGRPRYLWGGAPTDQPAEGPDLTRLVHQFHGFFPSLRELPIARSWTGAIAYSLDILPVIGPAPGYQRVLFVGGWCGHGIALGVLSGHWVQQSIDSGSSPDSLPWFRERAPLAPPEPLRWLAVRAGSLALEMMDRI